jgi:patatin-related protein
MSGRPRQARDPRGRSGPRPDVVESTPPLELSREVRFAVVMYGGVSLAIYINGATQELLRLVHATAPARQGGPSARSLREQPGQPRDTTWIYRKLAYLLADEELRARYRDQLKRERVRDEAGADGPPMPEPAEDLLEQAMARSEPLGLRFVVDILSGTSAGGINAVFLAKALANNQSLDQLKELWVSEGDLARLLNDSESLAGLGLPLQTPPQSLLNSQRMYAKILHALDGMDRAGESEPDAGAARFSLADELDLFVTVTDLKGTPQPLRLSDKLVYERRHRNVFHFQHVGGEQASRAGVGESHFVPPNNPFLAFAARCTSAFPFAFEPMCLTDIEPVRATFADYRSGGRWHASADAWRRFFRESADPDSDTPVDFDQRIFADGGYLDNKPFSYATQAMLHRSQDRLIVDRKLIYIEPNPAHPEDVRQDAEKPSAVANVKAATLDLPSYETIREDLEAVLQRNRLIWRVNGLLDDIERDMLAYEEACEQRGEQRHAFPVLSDRNWDQMALAGMIDEYGMSYLPYRRLRISCVTDDLARHLARLTGFDERSDHVIAIRYLIRNWRNRTYSDHPGPSGSEAESGRASINTFLTDFDFQYRLRRLLFLRHRLDELQRWSVAAGKGLSPLAELRRRLHAERLRLRLGLQPTDAVAGCAPMPELAHEDLPALATILRAFKKEIDRLYVELRGYSPDRWRRPDAATPEGRAGPSQHSIDELLRAVGGLGIERQHLDYILGVPWEVACRDAASSSHLLEFAGGDEAGYQQRIEDLFRGGRYGLDGLQARLDALGVALRACLAGIMSDNKERLVQLLEGGVGLELLPEPRLPPPARPERREELVALVGMCLRVYYAHFEHYDQIRFPILYETDVGEADAVEIIRISPEDATSLIDERAEVQQTGSEQSRPGKASGVRPRRKLAGTTLRNFGAFLDDSWRRNDIMWGRLDGAERLITALLPEREDADIRTALIAEAHMTILAEELPALDTTMARIRARVNAGEKLDTVLDDVLAERREPKPDDGASKPVALRSVQRRDLYEYVKTEYTVNRELDPQAVLRLMSRSTQVVGKMFENLARDTQASSKGLVWVVRLGQFVWSLVEIAVPQSLMNLLFRHWVKLLYVLEVFVIAVMSLFGVQGGIRFGWMLFGITAVTHVAVLFLEDYMHPRSKPRPRKRAMAAGSSRRQWLARLWSRFASAWSRWTRGWSRLLARLAVAALVTFAAVGVYLVLDLGVDDVLSRILPSMEDQVSGAPAEPASHPPRP